MIQHILGKIHRHIHTAKWHSWQYLLPLKTKSAHYSVVKRKVPQCSPKAMQVHKESLWITVKDCRIKVLEVLNKNQSRVDLC